MKKAVLILLMGISLVQTAHSQFVNGGVLNEHEAADAISQILDALSDDLNTSFNLPSKVNLVAGSCNTPNAFYNPQSRSVILCLELFDLMRTGVQRSSTDQAVQGLALVSQVIFILYHEVGHALIDVLNLPVIGQEEDGADQLAALLLSDEPVAALWAAEFWRMGGASGSPGLMSQTQFADEHDLNEQRFYNLACWTYGADPVVRGYIVQNTGLPVSRAVRCQSEFDQLSSSWRSLLTPHLRANSLFDDLLPKRNATGVWRFTEEIYDDSDSTRCTASGTLSISDLAGSLSGTMQQNGSCYLAGAFLDNSTTAAFAAGSAEGLSITFEIEGCRYSGTLEEEGTSIEGLISCRTTTEQGAQLVLNGRWLAVR